MTPEQKARQQIDRQLEQAGWIVQDYRQMNISAEENEEGVPELGLDKIKAFTVPLCCVEEQDAIIEEMEQKLSVIAAAEIEIARSLLRAARLRQSILKQAFEGKLVPQDPTDEPASVLARLRASRSAHEENGEAKTSARTRGRRAKTKQVDGSATE